MPHELIQLKTGNPVVRLLLIGLLLLAAAWSYFAVRWYVGDTLAEYFDPAESNLRVANMAASLAPDDPLTHWRVGQVWLRSLPLDQQAQALVEYEKAVSLSPNDYRLWMTLGTASEQAGDAAKAEKALKQAITLAPAYSYPRWYLGNLLLRNGRYAEAFEELRLASEADPDLRSQQFNLVWEIYNANFDSLKKAVGEMPSARADFGLYLLGRQKFEEGLRLWDSLDAEEKKSNKTTGEAMVANLISAYRYHDALKIWNDIASNEKFRAEVGRVFDGGFEDAGSYGPETVFGWQVEPMQDLQIGVDPYKVHSGGRSLRLVFHVRTNIEVINVSQLVPVATNTEYDLEFYLSTEKLETGSPPLIQVVDPSTSAVLVSSPAASNGNSDWTRVGLSFKTADKTEGVMIKIVRPSCGTQEAPVCPIFGTVWYDDFSLKRRN